MCSPSWLSRSLALWATHLRLEVLVNEDVIAVQLKAVLVADDHLLHALQAPDEDVVHCTEERLHGLRTVFGGQVLSEALEHPFATLRPRQSGWERSPTDHPRMRPCEGPLQPGRRAASEPRD